MNRKIPADAFQFYFGLGLGRSYQTAAEHFRVSKQAITALAKRERWQERVLELEQKARQGVDKKAVETLEAMTERHLKMIHVIAARALETLKSIPLDSAINAVRALDLSIKQERLIRGEPGDHTEFLWSSSFATNTGAG
jgi:transposase